MISRAAGSLPEICHCGSAITGIASSDARTLYTAKWEYVRSNPVRHGHVVNSGDWPYQGELNILEWHD